jgi:predicted GH43/DUF377 family glycosyl hydrolase
MVEVTREGIILRKTKLSFENEGVLNPAIFQDGNTIHLFYRAVKSRNNSSIGYCKLEGPIQVVERAECPVLYPTFSYESRGVEDPRIVKVDDLYYLTYTAYNGINALGCLATSTDLVHFEKQGVIVPQITYREFLLWAEVKSVINEKYKRYNRDIKNLKGNDDCFLWDKNVIFFPRRINGKICFLHRIKPDIQIVKIDKISNLNRDFWIDYFFHFDRHIVLTAKYRHEISYIGGGCPPIETPFGWLLIYHTVHDTIRGYVYSASAAMLELENPEIEISRLPYPLFSPEEKWEIEGEVNNVCFPTGTAIFGDTLYIYYGAADVRIACASVSLSALIQELLNFSSVSNQKLLNQ